MGDKAINILSHIMTNVWVSDHTCVAHNTTDNITPYEFEIAGSGRMIGSEGESLQNAERMSSFQYRDAARDRANERLSEATKFLDGKVHGAFVVAEADVHFFGITLQLRQV